MDITIYSGREPGEVGGGGGGGRGGGGRGVGLEALHFLTWVG